MLHGRLAVTFTSSVLTAHSPARLPDSWADSSLRAAARLVCNRRKYDHITPLLHDVLHWLPVPFHIEYKLCVLVFLSLTELLQSTCTIAALGLIPPCLGYDYDHLRGLISVRGG